MNVCSMCAHRQHSQPKVQTEVKLARKKKQKKNLIIKISGVLSVLFRKGSTCVLDECVRCVWLVYSTEFP